MDVLQSYSKITFYVISRKRDRFQLRGCCSVLVLQTPTKPSSPKLPRNITPLSSNKVDHTLAYRTKWWWYQYNFHGVGWPGYAAPIKVPISDALGCAARLLSPADSDGSDSFQWWPPVLTPIRLGDSGKLVLAPHISAWPTQQSRGEGGGDCSCRGPVSTFNFCFSNLSFATDLKF